MPSNPALDDGPFLRACRGELHDRVPVWFMRQAGRSLPEYRERRGSGSILDAIAVPELAAELTLQPIRRYGVDAAILFSDIVVPVHAIGFGIDIVPGTGPVAEQPFRSRADLARLRPLEPELDTPYVLETVTQLVATLDVPLIGFAGAPFTVASYLVEGGPSKNHGRTKALMLDDPHLWFELLDRLADIAIASLRSQIDSGASAVQLFDSWAGTLSPPVYEQYVAPASRKVLAAIADTAVPRIHFGVDTGELLGHMAAVGADVVGVDWRVPLDVARARLGDDVTLQGNLDPAVCLAGWPAVETAVRDVLDRNDGHPRHVFNLGHGVLPEIDPAVLEQVVELVHREGRVEPAAMTSIVVGAGITGLAAAHRLLNLAPEEEVVVLETSDSIGGAIRTSAFAGLAVDEAADAFLARVPWARELCDELGLTSELVSPAATSARIWVDGTLRDLPSPMVLGVPLDPDSLVGAGIVSDAAIDRLHEDLRRDHDPGPHEDLRRDHDPGPHDETVGELVRRRLGDEILELLVGPLIGGINAGDADRLSVRAAAPQLAEAADADPSLVRGLATMRERAGHDPNEPVFLSPRGGMGRVVAALGRRVGAAVRLNTRVQAVEPRGGSVRVQTEDGPIEADRCIVTAPADQAAAVLGHHPAAAPLGRIGYASVVLVTLAYQPAAVPVDLAASGFLVPRTESLDITACSWASSKWAELAGGHVVLRVSLGRDGGDDASALPDDEILRRIRADLATTMGIEAPPEAVRISRWPYSLPQYRTGHLDLVSDIEGLLAGSGIALAGAAYRGLGVPACIHQGRLAAETLLGG